MATLLDEVNIGADDVREIVDTSLEDGDINAMINTAYRMTLSIADALDDCGGEGMVDDIQKHLAAHFIVTRERRVKQKSVAGEYSVTYEYGELGEGLHSTPYGQTALTLDCTGALARLGLKKASLKVYRYSDFED